MRLSHISKLTGGIAGLSVIVNLFFSPILNSLSAQDFTRGIGVYPGNESENPGPVLQTDNTTFRNLALHRPAFHSSAYDYNLTAQLISDGIIDTRIPPWLVISTSQHGLMNKQERERVIDHNVVTAVDFTSASGWMQIELAGGDNVPMIDKFELIAIVRGDKKKDKGYALSVECSDDGRTWKDAGRVSGADNPWENYHGTYNENFKVSISLNAPVQSRFYRLTFEAPSASYWGLCELNLYKGNQPVEIGPSHSFASAWKSAQGNEEWVYVDLGASATIDQVKLFWLHRASEGSIQLSTDAVNWKDVASLPANKAINDDIKFSKPQTGRFVRILMKKAGPENDYILRELEVYGKGGLVAIPKPAPAVTAKGRLDLAGGAWRIQRESEVKGDGQLLSKTGYDDKNWIVATVPGTALVSYWNAGALPDPNFGDNQLMISESFFNSNFWYRNEFTAPPAAEGQHLWLNFDGINWKAEVYLNGNKIGNIDGAFIRGHYDVTGKMLAGKKNVLAVRIIKNATPGNVKEKIYQKPYENGGALGADNPTYHASIGWDWIPTVRGRNIGIWNDVYISTTGAVTVEDPFVSTLLPLPDTTKADVKIEVTLTNHENKSIAGTLVGKFGDFTFEVPATLPASSSRRFIVGPEDFSVLHLLHPKLWWPAGYGAQNLYPVELKFINKENEVSDSRFFLTGIRQMTYSEEGGNLTLWINGRRFIGRGGNWGFPEVNLQYRNREYDAAVHYHADMHFTMIRNWVGQTGDDEFFEACDRYGVMIWQDFWLANPWDGPNPDNNDMFLANAKDFVLRIRNHPSIALYCGRNEGDPPKPLDDGLREILANDHPGLHYISNSANGVVSGGGPYKAMTTKFYFQWRATRKLHSELGMPNVLTFESLKATMPDNALWPQGDIWGIHDFCLNGAQGGSSFLERMEKSYGKYDNAKDWTSMAQFVNYEGYRAMFEAQARFRMGMLLWMSHPCWPSFVWQTYDYFLEPTAAYFGCKKASEPVHIQWHPVSDSIEVVNYSAGYATGLIANVELINMDGTVKWSASAPVNIKEDSRVACIGMVYPQGLTSVHFIKLSLKKGEKVISENFYLRGLKEDNFQAINELPKIKLDATTEMVQKDGSWYLSTELSNNSQAPALMVRLKIVREKTGDRILPALYSDNYIALMPGEKRTIQMELKQEDTRGEKPRVVVEGFNLVE